MKRDHLSFTSLYSLVVCSSSVPVLGTTTQDRQAHATSFERAILHDRKEDPLLVHASERARRGRLNSKLLERAIPVSSSSSWHDEELEPDFLHLETDRNLGADDFYQGYGFDVSAYALKYIKCATIETWSDELVATQYAESVLQTDLFALFRLCPKNKCNKNSRWGCGGSHGDYIIDLQIYLAAMQEYHAEFNDNYCTYCATCNDMDDADAVADDDAGTNCAACDDYDDLCYVAGDSALDYDQFLVCSMFEGDNGAQKYLGPHCAADGRSIVVGVYADEDCSQLEDVDVYGFTGMQLNSDGLVNYYDTDCISCDGEDFVYADDDVNDGNGINVLELCGNLYSQSGKCHEKFNHKYPSKIEKYSEERVCSFIFNAVNNKYDEKGQIKLYTAHYTDAVKMYQNMREGTFTTSQVNALIFVITVCIGLLAFSVYTKRLIAMLEEGTYDQYYIDKVALERKDSGIRRGRTEVDEDYALPKEYR